MNKKFRSLELLVKFAVTNFSSGSHSSLLKDAITEIDSIRQYQAGDKKLDSKASLKARMAMSRVFNPEKEITLYILLDRSGSAEQSKEFIIITCLYLYYLAELAFDKVGLVIFSDKTEEILPSYDIFNFQNFKFYGKTDLEKALACLRKQNPNNALIFLLSDFAYELPNLSILRSISAVPTNKFVSLAYLQNQKMSGSLMDAETGQIIQSIGNVTELYENWLNDVKIKLRQVGSEFVRMKTLKDLTKFLLRN